MVKIDLCTMPFKPLHLHQECPNCEYSGLLCHLALWSTANQCVPELQALLIPYHGFSSADFRRTFSRPETQSNLAVQNNTVENGLTIQITGAVYTVIEERAAVQRTKVAEMLMRYRPALGNGQEVREVEAEPVIE
jgi:hypothetical protein